MKILGQCYAVVLVSSTAMQGHTEPVNVSAQYPIAAPLSQLITGNFTKTIVLSNKGTTSQITTIQTQKGQAQIDDKTALIVESNHVIRFNGKLLTSAKSTHYYSLDPLISHGSSYDEEQDIDITINTLPTTATIGDSDVFATSVFPSKYDNDLMHTAVQNWSLEQANEDTAWLCLHTTVTEMSSLENPTADECYEITPGGAIVNMKIKVTLPVEVLSATITFS